MMNAKAKEFTQILIINQFRAITHWFEGFKDKNYITLQSVVQMHQWIYKKLNKLSKSNLIANYNEQNIFNVDKTWVFLKCTPNKTFAFKGEQCKVGKTVKKE